MAAPLIVILTYGSRGDVQPLVALGKGLLDAGFRVRLAAPAAFRSFAEGHGLPFAALPGDPQDLSRRLAEAAGSNPASVIRAMLAHALPLAARMMTQVEEVCAGAEAVVHTFAMTNVGHEAARRLDVPDFSVQLFPVFAPTGAFPAMMAPALPLGAGYNRLTHKLNTATFWWGSRSAYAWLRRRHPNLPPLTGWPFAVQDRPRPPLLFAISPTLLPRPEDWGTDVHVTGYFSLALAAEWTPPPDLAAFLADGPPPVYVGFGSMIARDAPRLIEVALEALASRGCRGLLALGWGGGRPERIPDGVFVIDEAPHEWLFPRSAALVHHGGAGTTGAGLRSGRPQVVVPFTGDQPFWAGRVHQLGVAAPPIPRKHLTVEGLSRALQKVLEDPVLAKKAEEVGAQVRDEDGVGQAVEIIREGLGSRISD